jgi:hypothetical protein
MNTISSREWNLGIGEKRMLDKVVCARTLKLNVQQMRYLLRFGQVSGRQKHSSILPLLFIKVRIQRRSPWLDKCLDREVGELLLDSVDLSLGCLFGCKYDGLVPFQGLILDCLDKGHGEITERKVIKRKVEGELWERLYMRE